jgi:hypothetical protein
LDLGHHCIPSSDGLVSSMVGLGGPANRQPCTLLLIFFLQDVDLVGQGSNLGKLEWSRLFTPCAIVLKEAAHEGREARLMILAIEPCLVPSLKRSFYGKIKEASTRAGLETYAPNNLSASSTRLVLQEDVVFEKRKVRMNPEENLTKMDENGDMKNRVRIKMNKLNLVVVQESAEEIVDREAEPTLKEAGEHHNFICVGCRDVLAGSRVPLLHRVVLEKMVHNELADLIFI